MSKFTEDDVIRMVTNPIYTGIPPIPRAISDEDFIAAAKRCIEERGIEWYFTNMLQNLRQSMQAIRNVETGEPESSVETEQPFSSSTIEGARCYLCDLVSEARTVSEHDHQLREETGAFTLMCEHCIAGVAIDSFSGGVAAAHGKMSSPLPLCEMHGAALAEKLTELGLPMTQIIKNDSEMN